MMMRKNSIEGKEECQRKLSKVKMKRLRETTVLRTMRIVRRIVIIIVIREG
jgi:hypothetical protein